MFVLTKQKTCIIQIVHLFIWFPQVIVVIICTGIALVVCQSDEKPPKEATNEPRETPAEKAGAAVKKAGVPTEKDIEKDCLNACEEELKLCLEPCTTYTFACNARCNYVKYLCQFKCQYRCYGMCDLD